MRARIFSEARRKWFTLAAVSFGLFMIMLDNTVVNVALPAIQSDLQADLSELQWVVTGYALTFAALMLIGGKVADAFGRRLIFVVGIAIFTVASLLCGLADSGEMLIAWRVVQGAGAALMNPATLSIIAATFPPHQRGMAIGIWAGVSALALAIGPLVGGLITQHVDWSWIFFVNVPVGVLAIAASFLFIDESRDQTHERLDLPGLATSGIGLFALKNVPGSSAAQTGAAFLPMTILIILIAPIAGRASDRIGSRGLLTVGMVLVAGQLLYFSRLCVGASFWNLLPGFLLGGVGMALTMTPSAAAATRSVPVDKAGVGAAVLNASRQVGGSL